MGKYTIKKTTITVCVSYYVTVTKVEAIYMHLHKIEYAGR